MHIQLVEDFLSAAKEHFGGDAELDDISTIDMIDCFATVGLKVVPDFQGEMSALYVKALQGQRAHNST